MPNETPQTKYRVEDILKVMEPGAYYTVPELLERARLSISMVKTLLREAENCRRVGCVRRASRNLYGLIPEETRRPVTALQVKGELKGYDAQMQQFRAMCEATRKRS